MRHPEHHIFDFTPESLAAWCVERGMPKFRAAQVLEWVYKRGVVDPGLMSNLSKLDREVLTREMVFLSGETVAEQAASDGTRKLLVQWDEESSKAAKQQSSKDEREGEDAGGIRLPVMNMKVGGDSSRQTECVMIPTEDRRTACISSQVGCPVGCKFCASGLGGLDGSLSAGRIVEQVWRLARLLDEPQSTDRDAEPSRSVAREIQLGRITNVVFMGMGEPLANLANVVHAVRTLNAEWGMGISARKITISTVGLPKAIEKLAEELDLPVTLALSLHAPNDEVRRQLIPWANYTTIPELLAACKKWFDKTGREITLEYTLLHGVNDRPEHAEELARFAKTVRSNVNLIRYNEVKGLPFKRPETEDVLEFQRLLRERNVNVHIRASRGRDIAAACGQLRHEKKAAGVGA